jgi:hypothetical protein
MCGRRSSGGIRLPVTFDGAAEVIGAAEEGWAVDSWEVNLSPNESQPRGALNVTSFAPAKETVTCIDLRESHCSRESG